MKVSFVALQPGISDLGTGAITVGRSNVLRSWEQAGSGLKLLGLERVEYDQGTTAEEILKNTVSVYFFLP